MARIVSNASCRPRVKCEGGIAMGMPGFKWGINVGACLLKRCNIYAREWARSAKKEREGRGGGNKQSIYTYYMHNTRLRSLNLGGGNRKEQVPWNIFIDCTGQSKC